MSTDNSRWEPDLHTLAKHQIVRGYLDAWVAIMSHFGSRKRSLERLLVVDGFAGPGLYDNGERGSPLLMMEAVRNHTHDLPLPVRLLFIEKDPEVHARLESNTRQAREEALASQRFDQIRVMKGECETIIRDGLARYDEQDEELGPAFFFLDQFGYSQVSMGLIGDIMRRRYCEAFTFLNWRDLNRWMRDESKADGITRAFGGDEWRKALGMPPGARAAFLLDYYTKALRGGGNARYVWHFAMHDSDDRLIYWLFFCTNSLIGLKEMKRAMLRVDQSGQFRFSDRDDPRQGYLFDGSNTESVADRLYSIVAGKTMTVSEVEEVVLTETAGVLHKGALKVLEGQGKLTPVDPPKGRRPRTYPDKDLRLRIRE